MPPAPPSSPSYLDLLPRDLRVMTGHFLTAAVQNERDLLHAQLFRAESDLLRARMVTADLDKLYKYVYNKQRDDILRYFSAERTLPTYGYLNKRVNEIMTTWCRSVDAMLKESLLKEAPLEAEVEVIRERQRRLFASVRDRVISYPDLLDIRHYAVQACKLP
jgi:hypothetical protein